MFNKMVDGNQLTVQFHVDNLNASHQNKQVMRDFVNSLWEEFKEDKLTENEGLLHAYLGLQLITPYQEKLCSQCLTTWRM